MSKLGMVVVLMLLGQFLLLEAMTPESEPPLPLSGLKHPVSSSVEGKSKAAEAPQIRRLGKHHFTDKSVAGGGVIIGGFATAIFAAVFCYIRVTRKRDTAH